MATAVSPFRYPGGKACLFARVATLLQINNLTRGHYAEPYAGGAGLALPLLFGGYVSDIHINDIDRAIWSVWNQILNNTETFIQKIEAASISVEEWKLQKNIYQNQNTYSEEELAFATFFLNRTNRSGIIKGGGLIGGYKQNGNYKIDCRFNKLTLINRIKRIAKYSNRIHLTNLDALDFIENFETRKFTNAFLCIDPPYYKKGPNLYTAFYQKDDHKRVRDKISNLNTPWILTYDDVDEIRNLYSNFNQKSFSLNYSAGTKRKGGEVLITSSDLIVEAFDEVKKSA